MLIKIENDFIPFYIKAYREYYGSKLKQQGFQIHFEKKIGDVIVDLVAEKANELIGFEFKVLGIAPSQTREFKFSGMKKALKSLQPNAEFKIVFIPLERDREIEIQDIETTLFQFMEADGIDPGLDAISSHTRVEGVSEVDIESIEISRTSICVSGQCTVEVNLQYGSGSDQDSGMGMDFDDSYPCQFEMELNKDLEIVDAKITIDTSSFYE